MPDLPTFPQSLSIYFRLLRRIGPPDSKRSALLRRHLYDVWRSTVEYIDKTKLLRKHPEWREGVTTWKRLGNHMPDMEDALEDDDGISSFPPLERCHWTLCECSVHKPAHRLKVCKGCWVVAYCGSRCQARYACCRIRVCCILTITTYVATGRREIIRVYAQGEVRGERCSRNNGLQPVVI